MSQLRASAALYSGPSGTGPNEAAHSNLNEVFKGLGSISEPLFQRLACIAWLRGVANSVEAAASTGDAGVRSAMTSLRAWYGSWSCTLSFSLATHLGLQGAGHPLSSGPMFAALTGAALVPVRQCAEPVAAGAVPVVPGAAGSVQATPVSAAAWLCGSVSRLIQSMHSAQPCARKLFRSSVAHTRNEIRGEEGLDTHGTKNDHQRAMFPSREECCGPLVWSKIQPAM